MNARQKDTKKHLHIIGICGVATSAIAIAFKDSGWKVTGSDKGFFPPVSTELEKAGVEFYAGWHPENIGKPDLVMTGGSGGSPNNPEIIYARENKIPVMTYAETVQKYFIKKNSIVAVGTWGKTTNSALLSFILEKAKLNPSYFTGGISLSHKSGKIADSDWSVVEGDEYQASISDKRPKFAFYNPTHLLLTSVSWDHADLYPTEESYFNEFKKLVETIPKKGLIVANKDNKGVEKIVKDAVFYAKENADYTYSGVKQSEQGLDFTIHHKDKAYEIHSPMLGEFQAENITGCFAMASEIGIEPKIIIEAIRNFRGLKRRLEKRYQGNITVLDDIAHSAEKASFVLENLRKIYRGKIIAVFEPNIGGRKKESAKKYDNAFKDADLVIIPRLSKLKVSKEKEDEAFEGEDLVKVISKTHQNARFFENDDELINTIVLEARKDDIVVFLGSHGFRGMIETLVTFLRRQSL